MVDRRNLPLLWLRNAIIDQRKQKADHGGTPHGWTTEHHTDRRRSLPHRGGAKDPERVADRVETSTSSDGRITIRDNRKLCAHSGRCTDNLASVFRLGTEPWIDVDAATADAIAAVVDQCPSGALSYTLDGIEHRDRGGSPSAGFAPGGPYVLSGDLDLVDVDMPEGSTTDHCTLCRCGASQNKPFCSGKHWEVDLGQDAPG